ERVRLAEFVDGKIGFERQKFVDVRSRLFASPEMTQRSDQRLVAVDEIRNASHDTPPDNDSALVIAFESVCDDVDIFVNAEIRIDRAEITMATEPPERLLGLANVAICCSAQRPNRCEVGV